MIDRFRTWLGARIVQLGVRVIGFDPDANADRRALFDLDEPPDEEYGERATFVPAQLNDHARKMIQDGLTATPPTKAPSRPDVLRGSASERIAEERKRHREAMLPKKR